MKLDIKLLYLIILLLSINNLFVSSQEKEEKPINIKVVPAKTNKLTLDDMDEIKMEILHDVMIFNLIR